VSRRAAGAIADPRKLYIDQAKKKAAPVDSDVDFDDSPAPTAKAAPKARAARTTRGGNEKRSDGAGGEKRRGTRKRERESLVALVIEFERVLFVVLFFYVQALFL
jgi:hypothetical protein